MVVLAEDETYSTKSFGVNSSHDPHKYHAHDHSTHPQSTKSQRGLLSMIVALSKAVVVLEKLSSRLHMLEASVGLQTLLLLIDQDRQWAAKSESDGGPLLEGDAKNKNKNKNKNKKKGVEDDSASLYITRAWNQCPRSVWELLGYVESFAKVEKAFRTAGKKQSMSKARLSWLLDVDGMGMGGIGGNMTIGQYRLKSNDIGKDVDRVMSATAKAVDLTHDPTAARDQLGLWDAEAILRCDSADMDQTMMESDELGRGETPKFMALEAAKFRLLAETHLLRALHEGFFDAITHQRNNGGLVPLNSTVVRTLFKFSVYLFAWNDLSFEDIAKCVFSPARTRYGLVHALDAYGCTVIPVDFHPIAIKDSTVTAPTNNRQLSGGIFGPNRLLASLGDHVQDIFNAAYAIPPIFPGYPVAPPGIGLTVLSGFGVGTSLQVSLSLRLRFKKLSYFSMLLLSCSIYRVVH